MKQTILVTGSNGLLGQKIIYSLLQKKTFNIVATSKGENRLIEKQGYTYYSLDITDKEAIRLVFSKIKPDAVINTAAMTNVDACETAREDCFNQNVNAVKYITEVLEELSTSTYNPHLIHLSTDFIFDGEKGSAYVEDDKPNPIHYYALTKYEGEKVVQSSRLSWAILRTIIVYGVVDNMSRSNIVLWAKNALQQGQKINVVDDQFRSPTLAEDLAEACIVAAEKKASGIYHVSGPEVMSVLEMVYRIADFWKLDKSLINPVKSASLNQPAKRPPRTGFIIDKAVRELNYHPRKLEEGLAIMDAQLKK